MTAGGRLIAACLLGLSAGGDVLADPPASFRYLRRDTRAATRDATLAQYMIRLDAGDWFVAGPFDNRGRDKHDVVYPPEGGALDLEATYAGKDARPVRWERIPDEAWMKILAWDRAEPCRRQGCPLCRVFKKAGFEFDCTDEKFWSPIIKSGGKDA